MIKPGDRRRVSAQTATGLWSRWVMQHQIDHQSAERGSYSTPISQNNRIPSRSSPGQIYHSIEPGPFLPQSIVNSPEFTELRPGPDYQRMESTAPSNMAGNSYFSRAYNWIREFKSLPWVAAGPITVEYDATIKLSLPREPLLTWENKHLKHTLRCTPEVDLTAGESPPVSSSLHLSTACRQNSSLDNCYYANENGQIWPVVVTSPETTSPSSGERVTPPSNLPHANGILQPVTPTPLHMSSDGTWRVNKSRSPLPVEATALIPSAGDHADVDLGEPSRSVLNQSQSQSQIGQPSSSVENVVRSGTSPPSSHSRLNKDSARQPRSLLRRARNPLENTSTIGISISRAPRWLYNLVSSSSEPRSHIQRSIGNSEGDRASSEKSEAENLGHRSSWVEIVDVNAEGSDIHSTDSKTQTEIEEDRDLQIARALQLEEEGTVGPSFSTLLLSPAAMFPLAPQPSDSHASPSSHHSSSHFHIVLASSHHGDSQLSSSSASYFSPYHAYSGYVSTQPLISEGYGQPVHAGHHGYVSSTVHSNTTSRTPSRAGSGRRGCVESQ